MTLSSWLDLKKKKNLNLYWERGKIVEKSKNS